MGVGRASGFLSVMCFVSSVRCPGVSDTSINADGTRGKGCKILYNQSMQTYASKQLTFNQVFQEAMRLSIKDQRLLLEELAKLSSVKLTRPSKADWVAGRKIADEVCKELEKATDQSLDDAMRQLRGRLACPYS